MSRGLHAQAVSADHQRMLYRPQFGNLLIHLVFLSRNFSRAQASILFSHHQFLFSSITISRHTQLSPRPVPSFCPGHWLITHLWATLCLSLFIKKKGFYEAYHFAQGISLLSRGKEKVQCVNASPRLWELHVKQKHSAGSGTDNSPQPWASHLGIFVGLALF